MITSTNIDLNEAVEQLTGFDEQEIDRKFGGQVGDLLELKPTTGMRAIAYVLVARDLDAQEIKNSKAKAYDHVMGMTIKEIADFFPEESPEVNPDEPVTPAGEGDSSEG